MKALLAARRASIVPDTACPAIPRWRPWPEAGVSAVRCGSRRHFSRFGGAQPSGKAADFDSGMRRFESFSIGAGWCQALSDCSVDLVWDATRRVLASLRDRHFGPPMMGSGGCGGPISRRVLAVRLYGRHRDSKRTRLIHRPCGDIAPPVGGIHVSPVVFYMMSVTSVH